MEGDEDMIKAISYRPLMVRGNNGERKRFARQKPFVIEIAAHVVWMKFCFRRHVPELSPGDVSDDPFSP